MCTTVPLSGHHDFIMELLFGVRQKSHQSFCEVQKTVFFTFSSRWIFISLRFSHLKGVTFYRLYEIKSVPDRKEMSQRSSVPTQIRDIYHFQRTVQFRHRSLQSLLSIYSMVCWWQISYEYGFHLNGKRFLEVSWKIIERTIDWLLSNSFEIQFGWVENQLRKRLALKFGFSNSQILKNFAATKKFANLNWTRTSIDLMCLTD